jgi:hypothetical protein
LCPGLLASLVLCASAAAAPKNVRVGDPAMARSVRDALHGASRRLARSKCQQVLLDFNDAAGRTLQASLEERQETPEAYIQGILFYDGSRNERCAKEGVLAFTTPGGRIVFLCAAEVRAQARRGNSLLLEVILIHEMLHSLGLGEDPPSTREITNRVLSRCG